MTPVWWLSCTELESHVIYITPDQRAYLANMLDEEY
jgi:hypothetical protein